MYDIGFRIAALKLYSYFLSLRKTSKILNISISTISRWNANICIKKRNRIPVKNSEALRNFVKTQTTINPCITCPILCAKIQESFKFSVSRQLVNIIMKQVNFSFKRIRKRGFSKHKEQKTKDFVSSFKTNHKQNTVIVSIDESGFDHRGNQIYGYAPKGIPAVLTTTYSSDRKRYNLLLAVFSNGTKYFNIFNKPITSEIFCTFFNNLPVPKDHLILMDNAAIHRTQHVKDTIMNRNLNVLYTPPYSPEYAPIELVFGQIKQKYYKARFFSTEPLGELVSNLTESVLPISITKSFAHVINNYINAT